MPQSTLDLQNILQAKLKLVSLNPQQLTKLRELARSGRLHQLGIQWIQLRSDNASPLHWELIRAEKVRTEVRVPQERRAERGAPAIERPNKPASKQHDSAVESSIVRIYRCAKVVKGGRTFSFGALVIAGDRRGNVGIGYGKANEVPRAVEKATKDAQKHMIKVSLNGTTIPHTITGRSGASSVTLVPARPGTGVTAGKSVRPCLELAGITDILTKAYGSTSPKNLVKATVDALSRLKSREAIEEARGVKLARNAKLKFSRKGKFDTSFKSVY